jgi:hypothetical protein
MRSLSPGRILGAFLFPEEGDHLHSDTKTWIQQVGRREVKIARDPEFPQGTMAAKHTHAGSYSQVNQKDPIGTATTTTFEPVDAETPRQRVYMA